MGTKQSAVRIATAAARTPGFGRLTSALENVAGAPAGVLGVLMYHRVAPPDGTGRLDPALVSASPAEFAVQVEYLAARRRLVSLDDVLEARRGGRRLPPGAVLLTFDDAYRDFAEHAWPVLRRFEAPVTLFVATAYPGRPERSFWWDRLYRALAETELAEAATPVGPLPLATPEDRASAMASLRDHLTSVPHAQAMAAVDELVAALTPSPGPPEATVLDWGELRALSREGVALAPHSRTHPRLDRVPVDEARDEILGSSADLEREIGHAPPVFAYPGGGYTREVVGVLGEAGFAAAFTTRRGVNDLARASWLELRRINVGQRTTVPLLRLQLLARPRRAAAGAAA